ncbi:MAG: type VI secretion system tip protein VgrG [Bacteroidota bacterium]
MATADKSLVSFKILINGSAISETYDIYELKVQKLANRIASAKLKILDGSVADESFPLSSGDDFVPGNEIELQAGFDLSTESIFKGIITSQSIQYKEHSGSMLLVECRDKAVKMTIGQNNGVFTDSTDSDVMQTLASNHGLSADVSSTSNTYPQIIQYYSTDWDFLLARAEVNGMVVVASDNQLTVGPPKVDGSPVETLTFGNNVFEFNTKMDARTQLSGVQATAWDYKNQALVDATASDPSVPDQGNISGSTLSDVVNSNDYQLLSTVNLDSDSLKSWADGQLLKSRMAKIRGEMKVDGNAAFKPNVVVQLKGMGSRFDGTAYVSGVVHEVSDGNWWSYLTIGLDPEWFAKTVAVTARPASALLPGIRGLQNGTVKQIYDDPKSETRIEVEVPIFKNSGGSTSVWARWAQPYASSNAGQFFMPEVGDEVVLGFLNEDPRFPVVLGSLYSSQKAPPYTPAEENPIKGIVTKNQLKIEFDDEKKVLTITTPGSNQIVLSDEDQGITIEDQNDNKITMNSGGIALSSASDIQLTAEGSVTISGTAGVTVSSEAETTVSSEASLSMSGLEVSISGETSLSASGGAEASISAGGELALTGAMIMLN